MRRKLPKQPNVGSVGSVYDDIEQFLIYEWLKGWLDLQYRDILNKISLDDLLQLPETVVDTATGEMLGHSVTRPIRPAWVQDSRTTRPCEANAVARLVLSGKSKRMPRWRHADVDVLLECWGPGMNRRDSDVHRDPISAASLALPNQPNRTYDPRDFFVGYLPAIDINVVIWTGEISDDSRHWPLAVGWFRCDEDFEISCTEIIRDFNEQPFDTRRRNDF